MSSETLEQYAARHGVFASAKAAADYMTGHFGREVSVEQISQEAGDLIAGLKHFGIPIPSRFVKIDSPAEAVESLSSYKGDPLAAYRELIRNGMEVPEELMSLLAEVDRLVALQVPTEEWDEIHSAVQDCLYDASTELHSELAPLVREYLWRPENEDVIENLVREVPGKDKTLRRIKKALENLDLTIENLAIWKEASEEVSTFGERTRKLSRLLFDDAVISDTESRMYQISKSLKDCLVNPGLTDVAEIKRLLTMAEEVIQGVSR